MSADSTDALSAGALDVLSAEIADAWSAETTSVLCSSKVADTYNYQYLYSIASNRDSVLTNVPKCGCLCQNEGYFIGHLKSALGTLKWAGTMELPVGIAKLNGVLNLDAIQDLEEAPIPWLLPINV